MITKENYAFFQPNNTNNTFALTRAKLNYCRIIILTSLFWVFIDAFVILYFTDCSLNRANIARQPCDNTEINSAKIIGDNHVNRDLDLNYDDVLNKGNLIDSMNRKKQRESHQKPSNRAIKADNENKNDGNFIDRIKSWFKEDNSLQPTNPPSWPGENGKAVVIPDNLKDESQKRFKENQFNIVASDLIALNRSVPDQRSEKCRNREYRVDLPTTSIIIVFHNEGNSTLLRGLTSIVRKSPIKYLKEIILVDDASEGREYLHDELDEFLKTLPVPVKIFRNKERLGLMRSRLRGADAATGDTMTFLDAHIEATDGWLPPLLAEIRENRKAVPCPVIDVISDDNFEYLTGSELTYGGFDSHFVFDWIPVPERENVRRGHDHSLPLRTPTMAGGLFTIDRSYFYELGAYDEGMDIWGAENLEMSFRIWMCGGTLLILPCSHVGHVFRKQTPYTFPGGTNRVIFRNNRRLVDVWTDEYASYFHRIIPDLNLIEAGDLTKRIELRKNLQCKSFKWYLDNIYPEAPLPRDFFHVGSIQNTGLNYCLDTMNRKANEDAGASYCHGQGGNQIFEYSKSHQLAAGSLCLDSNGVNGVVKLTGCSKTARGQQWNYDNINQFFRNRETSSCLAINETNNNVLITVNCDTNNQLHKWTFKDPIFTHRSE